MLAYVMLECSRLGARLEARFFGGLETSARMQLILASVIRFPTGSRLSSGRLFAS